MPSATSWAASAMLGMVVLGGGAPLVWAKALPLGVRAAAASWSLPSSSQAPKDGPESTAAETWADVLSVDPVYESEGESRIIVGYQVQYRYQGMVYATRLHHDPGNRLRLRVQVTPVEE